MIPGEAAPTTSDVNFGEHLTSHEEATWQTLSRRAIWRWRLHILRAGVIAIALLTVFLQPSVNNDVLTRRAQVTTAAAAALVVIAVGAVWPVLQHRHWRYRLAGDALELERGVMVRRRSVIPYSRVQQIDISRSLIDRMLGLSVAKLLTASSGTDARVPGLTPQAARAFRLTVLTRTGRHDAV